MSSRLGSWLRLGLASAFVTLIATNVGLEAPGEFGERISAAFEIYVPLMAMMLSLLLWREEEGLLATYRAFIEAPRRFGYPLRPGYFSRVGGRIAFFAIVWSLSAVSVERTLAEEIVTLELPERALFLPFLLSGVALALLNTALAQRFGRRGVRIHVALEVVGFLGVPWLAKVSPLGILAELLGLSERGAPYLGGYPLLLTYAALAATWLHRATPE